MASKLTRSADGKSWVWAIIAAGVAGDDLVAWEDQEQGRRFVPIFASKEEALAASARLEALGRAQGEVQAVVLEELKALAQENSLSLWLVDGAGRLIERLHPEAQSS